MSLAIYNFLHIAGLVLLLHAIGAFLHHQATAPESENPRRRSLMIQHGVGLLILLVSGFGQLARLGIIHSQAREARHLGAVRTHDSSGRTRR